MEINTSRMEKISVEQFIALRRQSTRPINGMNIPNIHYPAHLVSNPISGQCEKTIANTIRQIFNSLTTENQPKVIEYLKTTIMEQVKNSKMIEEIAEEILHNFVASEQHISNYMLLLNSTSSACFRLPELDKNTGKDLSPTIGNHFLCKCKDMIFKFVSEENIRKLAEMDTDDLDEMDLYNKEREKIISLIVTICHLYDQRTTAHIKLTAMQLYDLISIIIRRHNSLQQRMKDLGNPEDTDCEDEDEYEICRKMCTLYAEQLYTFMNREAKAFALDPCIVKGKTMANLVGCFKNEIIPTLTERYLISNCEKIKYE